MGRFNKVAFVASATPDAQAAAAGLADLRRRRPGRGRRGRGPRRRRADAADACTVHGHRKADLRHEQGLRRLPDERVPGGRPRSSGSTAAQRSIVHPLLMTAVDIRGQRPHGAGHQRGLHAAPDLPGGEAARSRWTDKVRLSRTHRRRRADRDAGRLDRLQPLGQRADPAPERPAPGADADLGLPAAALARRAPAGPRLHHDRGHRSRTGGR